MICATCRYALPVDPEGHWRERYGKNWSDTHVHCMKVNMAYGFKPDSQTCVIVKTSPCTLEPSGWESSGE